MRARYGHAKILLMTKKTPSGVKKKRIIFGANVSNQKFTGGILTRTSQYRPNLSLWPFHETATFYTEHLTHRPIAFRHEPSSLNAPSSLSKYGFIGRHLQGSRFKHHSFALQPLQRLSKVQSLATSRCKSENRVIIKVQQGVRKRQRKSTVCAHAHRLIPQHLSLWQLKGITSPCLPLVIVCIAGPQFLSFSLLLLTLYYRTATYLLQTKL